MPAQKSWAATKRKISMLNICDQRLPEVILCFFWIYLLVCAQYIKTNEFALFWAQILRVIAANTVGLQACRYKIRTSGHSPGSHFFPFLIKLFIEKLQVPELEVSLQLFAERVGSLLYSTQNSNLHTKAAGQAEASNARKFTLAAVASSGLTHWKIRSVIREVECASLCNNLSPDDCSCLKICLEDAKVHQVILHGSKLCILKQKRVHKMLANFISYRYTV